MLARSAAAYLTRGGRGEWLNERAPSVLGQLVDHGRAKTSIVQQALFAVWQADGHALQDALQLLELWRQLGQRVAAGQEPVLDAHLVFFLCG